MGAGAAQNAAPPLAVLTGPNVAPVMLTAPANLREPHRRTGRSSRWVRRNTMSMAKSGCPAPPRPAPWCVCMSITARSVRPLPIPMANGPSVGNPVGPGTHGLRLDQIAPDGTVVSRLTARSHANNWPPGNCRPDASQSSPARGLDDRAPRLRPGHPLHRHLSGEPAGNQQPRHDLSRSGVRLAWRCVIPRDTRLVEQIEIGRKLQQKSGEFHQQVDSGDRRAAWEIASSCTRWSGNSNTCQGPGSARGNRRSSWKLCGRKPKSRGLAVLGIRPSVACSVSWPLFRVGLLKPPRGSGGLASGRKIPAGRSVRAVPAGPPRQRRTGQA